MALEALEYRRMLSVEVRGGDVIVAGTSGADEITVGISVYLGSDKFGSATVNGQTTSIPFDAQRIIVWGGAGNDQIEVTLFNAEPAAVLVNGGKGHDTAHMYGGGEVVVLDGGTGNDTLTAEDHACTLVGGAGDDSLGGGMGADVISGSDGDDTITGGTGNDRIYGGAGDDLLQGDFGDDRIFGNAGRDTLIGGAGTDRLDGGPGRDQVFQDAAPAKKSRRTTDSPSELLCS